MPTVTVLAPDSALAMDEVIRQLGDNAYIVATHTRDGQVEILATNEPAQILPQRKRTTTVSFADAISEQFMQAGGATSLFPPTRVNEETPQKNISDLEPSHSATIVTMPQSRVRSLQATSADDPPSDAGGSSIGTSLFERLQLDAISIDATQVPQTPPTPAAEPNAALHPVLHDIAERLARLEARVTPQHHQGEGSRDPFEQAGFSAAIIDRLAPSRTAPERMSQFVTAMTKTLVAPDPLASLRAPVVVVVGPSGAGKTVLAGKIAALMRETETSRDVALISLSETPSFANAPLSIYARMLSVGHENWQAEQFTHNQILKSHATRVIDTNLEPETLRQKLAELRAQIGHAEVAVIIALPVGSSPARVRAQLAQYKDLDPKIALTKLDECELSPAEASTIAECGTEIAWLSGTCALIETMAPATKEMMTEFLTGLLADWN